MHEDPALAILTDRGIVPCGRLADSFEDGVKLDDIIASNRFDASLQSREHGSIVPVRQQSRSSRCSTTRMASVA